MIKINNKITTLAYLGPIDDQGPLHDQKFPSCSRAPQATEFHCANIQRASRTL